MTKKLEKLASRWSELSLKVWKGCEEYLTKVLKKNGNEIDWQDIAPTLPEYISVGYDGGNHPEYASNLFSTVYGLKLDKSSGEISLHIEDCNEYPLAYISVDELLGVCEFVDTYWKELGIKGDF